MNRIANKRDLLISLRAVLQKPVTALGLRPVAQRVYRRLLHMRYGKDRLARARQNGRTWLLDPEVALRGEWQEFDTVEWLRRVVNPGDTVIDVGANVGQMTLEAALLAGPTGRVIAVEPAPGNLRLLRAHVEANGFADRVIIVGAACGAADEGKVTLHVFGDGDASVGSGHTTRDFGLDAAEPMNSINVPIVSLDGLCRERSLTPAVIKIDVEGAEIDVIRGARQTLITHQPRVQFGFHPFAFASAVAATDELRALLAAAGYLAPSPTEAGSYGLAEYEAIPAAKPAIGDSSAT